MENQQLDLQIGLALEQNSIRLQYIVHHVLIKSYKPNYFGDDWGDELGDDAKYESTSGTSLFARKQWEMWDQATSLVENLFPSTPAPPPPRTFIHSFFGKNPNLEKRFAFYLTPDTGNDVLQLGAGEAKEKIPLQKSVAEKSASGVMAAVHKTLGIEGDKGKYDRSNTKLPKPPTDITQGVDGSQLLVGDFSLSSYSDDSEIKYSKSIYARSTGLWTISICNYIRLAGMVNKSR